MYKETQTKGTFLGCKSDAVKILGINLDKNIMIEDPTETNCFNTIQSLVFVCYSVLYDTIVSIYKSFLYFIQKHELTQLWDMFVQYTFMYNSLMDLVNDDIYSLHVI